MAYDRIPGTPIKCANVFELIEKFVERRAAGHATRGETYQQYLITGWRDLDTNEFFFCTLIPLKEGLTDYDKMMGISKKGRDGGVTLPGFRMLKHLDKEAVARIKAMRDMPWKEKLGYTQAEIRAHLTDEPDRQAFFNQP